MIVQSSEFDNNQSGFVTNSQNNDDYPSPQDGACPGGGTGPQPSGTQLSRSCWVFTGNSAHDNNNSHVPATGAAAFGPVGTGLVIAGARGDIVTNNRFYNNDAWGVLLVPYSTPANRWAARSACRSPATPVSSPGSRWPGRSATPPRPARCPPRPPTIPRMPPTS